MNKIVFATRLTNLYSALNACGIPAQLVFTGDGDLILSAALWNCEDGSAIRFEVGQDPGSEIEGEILAYTQPLPDIPFEEFVEEEFED